MINVEFDMEEFRKIIREEMKVAVREVIQENKDKQELPPMLTRKQFAQYLQISDSKSFELIGRGDFPVCREVGLRIPRDELLDWIRENLDWDKGKRGK